MTQFHHRKLPEYSALLSGQVPPDDLAFKSMRLQIWYNNAETEWTDPMPHAHQESDECFIVLRGNIIVEVEGKRSIIGPREFCFFPQGIYHQVVGVDTPAEILVIRAPAVRDKIY